MLDVKGTKDRAKTASLDKVADFHDYRTSDGYLYARIRAISSRVNKNHDGWPSVELAGGRDNFDRISKQAKTGAFTVEADSNHEFGYSTFLGKPIFVDHHNSDPKRARGVIVDAKLHIEDHKTAADHDPYYASAPDNHTPPTWVELLLEVDAESFPKLAKAIVEGSKDPDKGIDGFSMGCDVEKTQCNICSKEAHSPDEYCEHVRLKGAEFDHFDKEGKKSRKKSYEDCYGIKFFEISAVFDPADETALLRELIHEGEGHESRTAAGLPGYDQWKTTPPEPGGLQDPTYAEDIECPECDTQMVEAGKYGEKAHCPNCENVIDIEDHRAQLDADAQEEAQLRGHHHAHAEHAVVGAGTEGPYHNAPHSVMMALGRQHPEGEPTLNGTPASQFTPWVEPGQTIQIEHPDHRMVQAGKFLVEHSFGSPQQYKEHIQQIIAQPRQASTKTADNPLPQSEMLHAPEELDTLRKEEVCPVCGSNMDDESCEICGFVEPPKEFQNPDLERAKEVNLQDNQLDPQSLGEPPAPESGPPAFSDPAAPQGMNPAPTASVKNAMATWTTSLHPKVAGRINTTERPITTETAPASDEPSENVVQDETQPVTSKVRTASDFIAAAGRGKETNMSSTRTAAEPVPAAKPDKRVDVEGVGGIADASNEQASVADAQIDVEGQGGTGVEDVSADQEGVNVEKAVDTAGSGPTTTFPKGDQANPVGGPAYPTSAKKGTDPVDPVGKADDRVDLEQEVSVDWGVQPAQWTGTDGNGVTRQADPVTNETIEGDNIVNLHSNVKSSAHIFAAFKLADLEVELGLTQADKKYDRAAELEAMEPVEVNASLAYAQRVKNAGLKSHVREARRLPSFSAGVSKEASVTNTPDQDDSDLFS